MVILKPSQSVNIRNAKIVYWTTIGTEKSSYLNFMKMCWSNKYFLISHSLFERNHLKDKVNFFSKSTVWYDVLVQSETILQHHYLFDSHGVVQS